MIDKKTKSNLPMDNAIKSNKVRIINPNGSTDIMDKYEAIELAHSKNMNLVQIAFNPSIYPGSICKIIDYSKFKYEEKKRKKEQQKKARANKADLKEINFTIRIDDNDRRIKINHVKEFLANGDMVKVSIVLAKREMNRIDYAKQLMKDILAEFDGIAKLEGKPSFEGRFMSCTLKKI
jgi:translation initiation factor IF-3